jgi:phosphonate transport system ATP-binding protein
MAPTAAFGKNSYNGNYTGTLPSLINHFSRADRALAIHALERLDMAPFALQRADTLSSGQQQRVTIARALVQEPKILLADEPIASLDLHNATRVMEALRSINREDGITVICNLHHLDTARSGTHQATPAPVIHLHSRQRRQS